MRYPLVIIALILNFFPNLVFAQNKSQDPGWQWAQLSNVENSRWNMGIRTNFYNDIFTSERYIDTIYIEDTAFFHSGGWANYNDYHIALVKRNSKGEFLKAVDLFVPQNSHLYYADMEMDNESNVYLFGEFDDTLFVNDTIILPVNEISFIDLYLLKLDKDLNFKWAGIISSKYSDNIGRLDISEENDLYLSVFNMNSYDTVYRFVNFFNQDSAEIRTGLISLLKLDANGKIIWRNEIRQPYYGYTIIRNNFIGKDGYIYLAGSGQSDLYFASDTLEYQSDPGIYNKNFIIKCDTGGLFRDAFYYALHGLSYTDTWLCVDKNSDYYIPGIITDSIVIGTDSILVQNNEYFSIIAKLDHYFDPVWYHLLQCPDCGTQTFQLDLVNDEIAFAFHGTGPVSFMDNEYYFNYDGQILIGLFSPDGNLEEFQVTEASYGTVLNHFLADNCGNLLLEGEVRGTAHYGDDTIDAGSESHRYLAKNNRNPLSNLEMPTDTAGCGQITLYAPDGYLYYQWNDELSDQKWLIVDTSATVNLKAANKDGCWSECETDIEIHPIIEFSLGPDMTILLTDTLELYALSGYQSYLWSTGDTSSYLDIPASFLQPGNNVIWLDISDGLCFASDTIIIKVIDNSIIQENDPAGILLFPNPASGYTRVVTACHAVPERIIIYSFNGKKMLDMHPDTNEIDIRCLKKGIYIVKLVFDEFSVRRKLIVLQES